MLTAGLSLSMFVVFMAIPCGYKKIGNSPI